MYRMLLAMYGSFAIDKLDLLKWIIEQGVVHNITTATAFTEAVTKPTYVPYSKMFELLPGSQFKKLMEKVMHLKFDKFSSIIRPK